MTSAMNFLLVALLLTAAADPATPPPALDPAVAVSEPTPTPSVPPAATTETETAPTQAPAPIDELQPPDAASLAPRVLPAPNEDDTANRAYAACLESARQDDAASVSACFDGVVAAWPNSLAAVRARANVSLLQAERELASTQQSLLPPGRLELVGVAGIFGVWNAIAGGVVVASNLQGAGPGALLIGISAGSLALGVGFGVGGALIGDSLKLDEGASRMVASGILWGTNMGIGLLPVIFTLNTNGNATVPVLTVVGAGWVGGLGSLALTNILRLDTTAVSMVNSGGIWGSVIGGLVMTNLANSQVTEASAYSAVYIGASMLGLVGGGLLSQTVNVSWGETLIFDLGAVISGSVMGFGSAGIMLATGNDGKYATPILTSAIGVGVLGGYAAGMLASSMLRGADAPFWRSFGANIKPTTAKPMAVVDLKGQPVSMMPLVALAF